MKCSWVGPGLDCELSCVASYLLRDAEIETATRAELGRTHPDAGTVPDFVDLVEHVHDIEPQCGRLGHAREQIFVRDPHIDLGVRWLVIGIRKARTQTATVNPRG